MASTVAITISDPKAAIDVYAAAAGSVLLASWLGIKGRVPIAYPWREDISLAEVVLRDGTLYFLTLLALNVVDMVLYRLRITANFPLVIIAITSVFISRLMLNSRQVRGSGQRSDGSHNTLRDDSHGVQQPHIELSVIAFGSASTNQLHSTIAAAESKDCDEDYY
ncbi:hypothetical protein WOLCODRAFT_157903 [Wolfiporia cocos MD-104 SS10]|uniref:Uncharacterized protein n=1 Tax=Wolfiporia cocos (strain MD-104) TaxID=742152 RepID=A0A2H3J5H0_WOLCO|nr:hypothetical protein WOLCODRAFT_157903 [Wolfiporia cocos MD-104 SS10]